MLVLCERLNVEIDTDLCMSLNLENNCSCKKEKANN